MTTLITADPATALTRSGNSVQGPAPCPRCLRVHPSDTLLPTPRATDGTKGGPSQRESSGDIMLPSATINHANKRLAADLRRAADQAFRQQPAKEQG